jgi:hypothetical protein
MRSFKSLSFIILAAFVLPLASAGAAIEDEQWPIPNNPNYGHHSVLVDGSSEPGSAFSILSMDGPTGQVICTATSDEKCKDLQAGRYRAYLPQCQSAQDVDCIESVEASEPGNFLEYIYGLKHPNLFQGDGVITPAHASEPSIWSIPSAAHAFGDEYLVQVSLNNDLVRSQDLSANTQFAINVSPISRMKTSNTVDDVNGFANYPKCIQQLNPEGFNELACGEGAQEFGSYRCVAKMIDDAVCLLRHAFPGDVRIKVIVRLKKEPAAMLHGRLSNPLISITQESFGTKISVEAASVRVPTLYSGGDYSTLSDDLKKYWDTCISERTCGFSTRQHGNNWSNPALRNVQDYAEAFGGRALKLIPTFAASVQDKSIAAPSSWSIRTLSRDQMRFSTACFKSGTGFIGVVTTNSTTYSEGPPTFEDDRLTYKVASLHYLPDGSIFYGSYDLILRSDVARCLYGFSKAPISASISVLSEDGAAQVATTVVNESENWIYLSAKGFTFSSPSIAVKLVQEEVVVAPTPTPSPTPTPLAKKKTITCKKGKTLKRVVAVNPRCPKGYKRAAA